VVLDEEDPDPPVLRAQRLASPLAALLSGQTVPGGYQRGRA
jgi:hypothetical protein